MKSILSDEEKAIFRELTIKELKAKGRVDQDKKAELLLAGTLLVISILAVFIVVIGICFRGGL